mmetsp:Transcript_57068/g.152495  ORF Transcript_57068/g.152495 Transcript_57068/m.152495 type:complete len:431 (-) Transcript_57068:140-1432(-)
MIFAFLASRRRVLGGKLEKVLFFSRHVSIMFTNNMRASLVPNISSSTVFMSFTHCAPPTASTVAFLRLLGSSKANSPKKSPSLEYLATTPCPAFFATNCPLIMMYNASPQSPSRTQTSPSRNRSITIALHKRFFCRSERLSNNNTPSTSLRKEALRVRYCFWRISRTRAPSMPQAKAVSFATTVCMRVRFWSSTDFPNCSPTSSCTLPTSRVTCRITVVPAENRYIRSSWVKSATSSGVISLKKYRLLMCPCTTPLSRSCTGSRPRAAQSTAKSARWASAVGPEPPSVKEMDLIKGGGASSSLSALGVASFSSEVVRTGMNDCDRRSTGFLPSFFSNAAPGLESVSPVRRRLTQIDDWAKASIPSASCPPSVDKVSVLCTMPTVFAIRCSNVGDGGGIADGREAEVDAVPDRSRVVTYSAAPGASHGVTL